MRKILGILLVFMLTLGTLSSCYTSNGHSRGRSMPPGHAKKVYGHQSARDFAPGQQKKKHKKYKKQKGHKGNKGQRGNRGND